jgi:hypothetical protein
MGAVHGDAVHSSRRSIDQRLRFNENEGVHDDLIFTVQSGMSGHDWVAELGGEQCNARNSVRGGSPELSLELTVAAPSR